MVHNRVRHGLGFAAKTFVASPSFSPSETGPRAHLPPEAFLFRCKVVLCAPGDRSKLRGASCLGFARRRQGDCGGGSAFLPGAVPSQVSDGSVPAPCRPRRRRLGNRQINLALVTRVPGYPLGPTRNRAALLSG